MTIYRTLESEVRSYCRSWPVEFDTASGSWLRDRDGNRYLDFFAGAGALNYGHNPEPLKQALLEHVARDGVTHGLDMHTTAKGAFLHDLHDIVLAPRGLAYKVQFCGPTGTNAVESALKLARKVTGRSSVVHFTDSFHGMTLGALAVTGNAHKRAAAGVPLLGATTMPFDGYIDRSTDFGWLRRLLDDRSSGVDLPAAVIVETVQGEGGLNVARTEWLQALASVCSQYGILLVVDDVQMGVGRTGPFFSFEAAGIEPDIVCLSKSISGYGLPMALVLMKPELDVWAPGEHNGTFRGNNHAFVTASAALRTYWRDDALQRATASRSDIVRESLERLAADLPDALVRAKGRGLARGLQFRVAPMAAKACAAAFEAGLLVETAGPADEVLKVMPPLTVAEGDLRDGLRIVEQAVRRVVGRAASSMRSGASLGHGAVAAATA